MTIITLRPATEQDRPFIDSLSPRLKVLVENAIDAGARRLTIVTEHGGKRLIRVDDDGEGMEPADARLAIEREVAEPDVAQIAVTTADLRE